MEIRRPTHPKIVKEGQSGKRNAALLRCFKFLTRKPAATGLIIRQRLESESTVANPRNFQCPQNTEYDQYRVELQRYFAKRARDPNAVDDLVQSVYERILKYTKDGSVRDTHAYIFKAAVNVLRDANRKAQMDGERVISCDPRTLERYAEDQGLEFSAPDSSTAMNDSTELGRAFKRLPRTAQEAWAHKRDGLSYKEIARKMGVTEHAVKKYISTALQGIREHLTRRRSNEYKRSPK